MLNLCQKCTVQYATEHARQMADRQLEDYLHTKECFEIPGNKSDRGFIPRLLNGFSRKHKEETIEQHTNTQNDDATPKRVPFGDVQTAIAMSLSNRTTENDENETFSEVRVAEKTCGVGDAKVETSFFPSEQLYSQNIEEDMEIAKALSLSLTQEDSIHTDSTDRDM